MQFTYKLFPSVVLALAACRSGVETRFELLDREVTGIGFVNELNPTPALNIFNYLYYYDGGGVAAGDLNRVAHRYPLCPIPRRRDA